MRVILTLFLEVFLYLDTQRISYKYGKSRETELTAFSISMEQQEVNVASDDSLTCPLQLVKDRMAVS
ncbi:unnamed protein product [Caretta caretta]